MENKEVEMDAAAPARDEFQTQLQEQYLKSLEQLEEGDVVDGAVVQVTNDTVFIDVGYKSEGQVPIAEFTNAKGEVTIKVGDPVDVARGRVEPGPMAQDLRDRDVAVDRALLQDDADLRAQRILLHVGDQLAHRIAQRIQQRGRGRPGQ